MTDKIDPVRTNPDLRRGSYHDRGLPGEEATARRHLRVSRPDTNETIDHSDPIKGGGTAESTAQAQPVDEAIGQRGLIVLGRKNAELLESPVFHAGAEDKEEALPVFRRRETAILYLQAAGWQDEYEPVSLSPGAFRSWLTAADGDGISFVALDLDRKAHIQGQPQSVLPVAELIKKPAAGIYTLIQQEN